MRWTPNAPISPNDGENVGQLGYDRVYMRIIRDLASYFVRSPVYIRNVRF